MSNESYQKYLNQKFHVDLPGRKSRERESFEHGGVLPPNLLDLIEDHKEAVAIHKAIVAELVQRDHALREADWRWYLEHEVQDVQKAQCVGSDADKRPLHPFMQKVEAVKTEKGVDTGGAMKIVMGAEPKLYESYMKAAQRKEVLRDV